ncbi:hypothetical protein RJT34_29997 [Clitoria ternatea]|uniref:Uncharacterized protein n=1 Tax=Clitoria ternatea TaxID=43366 RepID=A0AAN9ERK1_CLITE
MTGKDRVLLTHPTLSYESPLSFKIVLRSPASENIIRLGFRPSLRYRSWKLLEASMLLANIIAIFQGCL